MDPSFWNSRFDRDDPVYGTAPNAFIAQHIDRLPKGGTVLDLGGGEGRNALFLGSQGYDVTLLDYSEVALEKATTWAKREGVPLQTLHADITTWTPERTWQAVVATFVHLPVQWQPRLYDIMKTVLDPGGILLAEWFRPAQRAEGYTSGGPPDINMMVTANDLRSAFDPQGIVHLNSTLVKLDEGPGHQGTGAVVRLIWEKPTP